MHPTGCIFLSISPYSKSYFFQLWFDTFITNSTSNTRKIDEKRRQMIMDKTMADRLIELREKNHLSQSAVANRIGVTPALISAYEKTERNPSIDKLIALADVYHTSTDYILGRSVTDTHATVLEVKDLSDAQIRILRELIEVMKHPEVSGNRIP